MNWHSENLANSFDQPDIMWYDAMTSILHHATYHIPHFHPIHCHTISHDTYVHNKNKAKWHLLWPLFAKRNTMQQKPSSHVDIWCNHNRSWGLAFQRLLETLPTEEGVRPSPSLFGCNIWWYIPDKTWTIFHHSFLVITGLQMRVHWVTSWQLLYL